MQKGIGLNMVLKDKSSMAKKKMVKGNIYKVINNDEIGYFQYFYSDSNYLGGDLIWVFNLKSGTDNLNEILESGYSFYFYTGIEAGLKMKKWILLGNISVPEKMEFYPSFRWRDLETGIWYKLQYDQKTQLGSVLSEEQLKIPIVSFQFPVGAVKFITNGKDFYREKTTDFESKYFEKNKKI